AGSDEQIQRSPDGPEAWSTASQLTVDERRLFPAPSAPQADINFDAVLDSGLDEDFLAAASLMPPPRPPPRDDEDDDAPMPPPSMLPSDDDSLGAAFD